MIADGGRERRSFGTGISRVHELSGPMGSGEGRHPSLQTLLKRFPDHVTLILVGFWMALRLADSGTRWQMQPRRRPRIFIATRECGPKGID